MFILRRITRELNEINTCLDIEYVLTLKEINTEEFEKTLKSLHWDDEVSSKGVYGFVTFHNGESVMPLYEKSNYFIMSSDGKTFANITKK